MHARPRSSLAAVAVVASALLAVPAAVTAQTPAATLADVLGTSGEQGVLLVNATGVQIYECKAGADGRFAWAFKEPRAVLTVAGKEVGRHYGGPTWEHQDGSLVKGRVAARADAPKPAADIPWLRLAVSEAKGRGVLEGVVTILRTNTAGGVRTGDCSAAGKLDEVPYTSDYIFLRKAG